MNRPTLPAWKKTAVLTGLTIPALYLIWVVFGRHMPHAIMPWKSIWQPSETWELPTIAILIGYCLFLLGVDVFIKTPPEKRGWRIANNVLTAIQVAFIAYVAVWTVPNYLAWRKTEPIVLKTEEAWKTASPQAAAAGKAYLQAIAKPQDPEAFQKAITPLLSKESWAFIADDPTLYNINGARGNAETKEARWKYTLPIGNLLNNTKAILASAEEEAQKGDVDSANAKVALILGIGNRISDHPHLISALIGRAIIDRALKTLEQNPSLGETKPIETELTRATKIEDKMQSAYYEEFRMMDRFGEEMARGQSGRLVGACLLFPPHLMESRIGPMKDAATKGTVYEWAKNEQREAFLTGQPVVGLILGMCIPIKTEDAAETKTKAESLLAKTANRT